MIIVRGGYAQIETISRTNEAVSPGHRVHSAALMLQLPAPTGPSAVIKKWFSPIELFCQ